MNTIGTSGLMLKSLAIVAMLLLSVAPSAQACGCGQTYLTEWLGVEGSWFDGANWSQGAPEADATARVDVLGDAHIAGGPTELKTLQVGYAADSDGVVKLWSESSLIVTCEEWIGKDGAGYFQQLGGSHILQNAKLTMGSTALSAGFYEMVDGDLTVDLIETIGDEGLGYMLQWGGAHTCAKQLVLADGDTSLATYVMYGGSLDVFVAEYLGKQGYSSFNHYGDAVHNIHSASLHLASGPESYSAYNMESGSLNVDKSVYLGKKGLGAMVQNGGRIMIGETLFMGKEAGGDANYLMYGGELTIGGSEYIGDKGVGRFVQVGGDHIVGKQLYVGGRTNIESALSLFSGSLSVKGLSVGTLGGLGVLEIFGAAPFIETANGVNFGATASLYAEDAMIYITKGDFVLRSTDEIAMEGLKDLTVVFAGVTNETFEVAGLNLGADCAGFDANFALDALVVGDAEAPSSVKLVDSRDNGNRAAGSEALYVHDITVGPGSTLNLNKRPVYYDGMLDNQGVITGGSPVYVGPCP